MLIICQITVPPQEELTWKKTQFYVDTLQQYVLTMKSQTVIISTFNDEYHNFVRVFINTHTWLILPQPWLYKNPIRRNFVGKVSRQLYSCLENLVQGGKDCHCCMFRTLPHNRTEGVSQLENAWSEKYLLADRGVPLQWIRCSTLQPLLKISAQ